VGLAGRARTARELSGGEQQRAALARALAPRPAVLLLDEPFSAVDAPRRAGLRAVLRDVGARVGVPMVLVTHDPADALALAETVVLMDGGAGDGGRGGAGDARGRGRGGRAGELCLEPLGSGVAERTSGTHAPDRSGSSGSSGSLLASENAPPPPRYEERCRHEERSGASVPTRRMRSARPRPARAVPGVARRAAPNR
jgi:iron(III) transport system ATP-binding protein